MATMSQAIADNVASGLAFGTSFLASVQNVPLQVIRNYIPYIAFVFMVGIALHWGLRWLRGKL